MFRSSNFEKNLENATSHLHLEPDWPSILLICDAIRQNDVTAKQAFLAIKKKMTSPNPHTAFYALLVLESVVKNCGTPMHEEISIKENCEMFSGFIELTPHENVRAKMLELIQTWAYAFRTSEKYQAIKDTMTILKTKGHSFPELKEADAMFTADTAPDWADGKVCHRCRVEFSFTQRKHHCRNCGQIFCAQCSSKLCPLPKFGIEKDVRVCDGCFVHLQKPSTGKLRTGENDLPAEYLSSSLAQQAQIPPRKTEQELKEEEELQLALALSQSEAEQKNKVNINYRILQTSPGSEASSATIPDHAPIEETPTDPELAKYLNRNYWEQRKTTESPASPSAPSPMPQLTHNVVISTKNVWEDNEVDEFSNNMKSQVEIFVNRMKSNSSRGRNISNDSSVQTLFMNLTSLHSQLLTYIKDMDDKRMWYEQLQDKLAQVKDSRAALDVLRQEHVEKLRRFAEEQERQRQLQMAHKLEIMRKKKQEYLQYQRQLALQRIQEQEREMQMRQEQQKAQYRMGQNAFPFISGQNSPNNQMAPAYATYGYNTNSSLPRFGQGQIIPLQSQPGMPAVPMPGMYAPVISPLPIHPNIMVQGPVPNMPNQPQPPVSAHSQSQMSTMPGSVQIPLHQIPLNVPRSNAPIVSHPTMIQSTVPPGIIPGQSYPPNAVGISTNAGLPNTQTMPGIPQIAHNNQQAVSVSQSHQQPNSIPIPNSAGGQMPPIIQTGSAVPNNEIQQNAGINSASKKVEEEANEVSTAELISFD